MKNDFVNRLQRDLLCKFYTNRLLSFIGVDLRIKQEPVAMTDRETTDKLAERLSSVKLKAYSGGSGFDGGHYGSNSNHIQHGAQVGHAIVPLPPAHPPTPDLSPAPTTPAMWNTKICKAGTVTTPDGKSDSLISSFFNHSQLKIKLNTRARKWSTSLVINFLSIVSSAFDNMIY